MFAMTFTDWSGVPEDVAAARAEIEAEIAGSTLLTEFAETVAQAPDVRGAPLAGRRRVAVTDLPAAARPGTGRGPRPRRGRAAAGRVRGGLVAQPLGGDDRRLRGDARRRRPGVHLPHGRPRAGGGHHRSLRCHRGDRRARVPARARLDTGPAAAAARGRRPRRRHRARGDERRHCCPGKGEPGGGDPGARLAGAARPRPRRGGARPRRLRARLAAGDAGHPGDAHLHLGHHRQPQGRDDHPQERPLRSAGDAAGDTA